VLYVDFWASWCGSCQHGLRHTMDIQKKYTKAPFEVVYVNVNDKYSTFETAVKKTGLKGSLFYLDKKESEDIFKFLDFHGIPQYILIDKNGVLIEKKAPHPDSKSLYEKIDELLGK
jgi:thiol-disulfide isomerase/thioredoxin